MANVDIHDSPETRLIYAIISQATEDAVNPKTCNGRSPESIRKEAVAWIFSGDSGHNPFTFLWYCENVGLSADKIKESIRERLNEKGKSVNKVLGLAA
jgi:hypothetical protein